MAGRDDPSPSTVFRDAPAHVCNSVIAARKNRTLSNKCRLHASPASPNDYLMPPYALNPLNVVEFGTFALALAREWRRDFDSRRTRPPASTRSKPRSDCSTPKKSLRGISSMNAAANTIAMRQRNRRDHCGSVPAGTSRGAPRTRSASLHRHRPTRPNTPNALALDQSSRRPSGSGHSRTPMA